MRRSVLAIATVSVVLSRASFQLSAQGVSGTISGNVTDSSGGRVAGAVVRALNELTGEKREVTSDESGSYLFPGLASGRYTIDTEISGFRKSSVQGIALNVNQNARVDVRLEVGDVSQEVKVSADAPLVDTREVQLGTLIDSRRITDLPLNGRNVYQLVTI